MKRDRFNDLLFAIGQHAPDDGFRLLHETMDDFIGQILGDGFVFRSGACPAQGMAKYSSLGRDGERIASGPRLKLWPLCDSVCHILAQTMDSA